MYVVAAAGFSNGEGWGGVGWGKWGGGGGNVNNNNHLFFFIVLVSLCMRCHPKCSNSYPGYSPCSHWHLKEKLPQAFMQIG